ncbi:hypothetical protein HPB50_010576 [Hyalomma asiaticum]|uniref:Uncharacterized protein n=1 Tax=Hyalomma asiaticum TaxID=266040 RepID=A0ACB7SUM8_HYAAI|nr:hypothetical protein HPB50_010576 [Hyalomma asiaticum]
MSPSTLLAATDGLLASCSSEHQFEKHFDVRKQDEEVLLARINFDDAVSGHTRDVVPGGRLSKLVCTSILTLMCCLLAAQLLVEKVSDLNDMVTPLGDNNATEHALLLEHNRDHDKRGRSSLLRTFNVTAAETKSTGKRSTRRPTVVKNTHPVTRSNSRLLAVREFPSASGSPLHVSHRRPLQVTHGDHLDIQPCESPKGVLTVRPENDNSCCNQDNTLFDIGIAKVLSMPSFREFPLDDIRRTFTKIFDFHVRLSQGKLYGLPSFKRWDRSFINATDSGITALLRIHGGPLEVSYTGTVHSIPVDARVDVNIYIPWIGLFIYVEEPEPNSLRLAELRLSTDRVTFRVNKLDGDSLLFDFLRWLAEGRIGEAVRDNMGEIMTEVVHQFLGKIELFARNGTKFGDIKKPRADATFTPVFVLPGTLDRIYPSNNPLGPWDDPSKWGIFDYSVKRMAVASKLDPVVFTDVNDVSWNDWSFHIWNVTVDGLAYLRRGGDNYAVADRCGLNARVHLAMENIKVQLYATTDIFGGTLRLRIDVRIVGVDVLLKVKE